MENKTLSDKRLCVNGRTKNFHYKELDVKEFIQALKESTSTKYPVPYPNKTVWEIIDKLAGDKLI